jgi:hypothetical protein
VPEHPDAKEWQGPLNTFRRPRAAPKKMGQLALNVSADVESVPTASRRSQEPVTAPVF